MSAQLHERVAASAGAAQLAPEADEDRQLVEALFGSLPPPENSIHRSSRQHGSHSRELAVRVCRRRCGTRRTRLPQLEELAVAEAGALQEFRQANDDARSRHGLRRDRARSRTAPTRAAPPSGLRSRRSRGRLAARTVATGSGQAPPNTSVYSSGVMQRYSIAMSIRTGYRHRCA